MYVGNINAPRQIVIAGSNRAIIKVVEAARKSGARRAVRLSPKHCSTRIDGESKAIRWER